jgi:hypothetical protein
MKTTKKIAIATAAALAMFGISAVANAAPLSVTVNSVANATTSAAPQVVLVPSTNVIDALHTVAISATADTGTTVTFTASSTVKLVSVLNTVSTPVNVSSGVSTLTGTSNGSALTVYAYTTSTAVGSVTITNGAYSTIAFIKGNAGPAYNVVANVPGSFAINTAPSISVSTTDVFGNPIGGATVVATLVGATFADNSVTKSLTTSTVADVLADPTLVVGSKSATLAPVLTTASITLTVSASVADAVVGLPAPVRSGSISFGGVDLNAQIKDLNNKVTDLTAQLAASKAETAKALSDSAAAKTVSEKALADANAASKAEYNALVAKYNALAAAFTAKAKKYKFSSNITLVASK